MTKQQLRILYKQKRNALTTAERLRFEDLMLIQFQRLPITIANNIMTFAAIESQNEYDPILAEEYCFFKNPEATLFFPVANFADSSIQIFKVDDDTNFKINKYGIAEPVNAVLTEPNVVDIMFVPLLCFNAHGYRVGYGKGFYDNFIKLCKPNTIKIGFSFFDDIEIDDVFEGDKKLNFCVTPNKFYTF